MITFMIDHHDNIQDNGDNCTGHQKIGFDWQLHQPLQPRLSSTKVLIFTTITIIITSIIIVITSIIIVIILVIKDRIGIIILLLFVNHYHKHDEHDRNDRRVCQTQTSQELRMLSTVTLDCQVTKIVMNSESQL